jgi:hypothetical protein
MAHTQTHPEPGPEALEKGYEPDDLKGSWMVWFVIILIVSGVAVHIGLWFTLKLLASSHRTVDDPRSALIEETPVPPAPLQPTQQHDRLPAEDLQAMREHEDAVFNQLGWEVEPKTHQVQVPGDVVARVASQSGGGR